MNIKNEDVYTLKHFDNDVLTLKLLQDESYFEITLLDLLNPKLLPLGIEFSKESITSWILSRLLPEEHCHCSDLLRHLEASHYDKKTLINLSKCMTLKDTYWLKNHNDNTCFTDNNFYDNPLVKKLSNIAFDAGDYYYLKRKNCSPELTTVSDFRTCWIKEKGQIYLMKSAKTNNVQQIMELHSEQLCYEIASKLNIKCAATTLVNYRKRLCLKQTLFLNKNIGYISADMLIKEHRVEEIMNFCIKQGKSFVQSLKDMLLLDVITCNYGRRLKDFGFLVDNRQNKVIAFAPLFKNGTALFYDGFAYDIHNYKQYERAVLPVVSDSLITIYQKYLMDTPISRLDKLINFKFNRKRPHLLWEDRLMNIEQYLQKRIIELKGLI